MWKSETLCNRTGYRAMGRQNRVNKKAHRRRNPHRKIKRIVLGNLPRQVVQRKTLTDSLYISLWQAKIGPNKHIHLETWKNEVTKNSKTYSHAITVKIKQSLDTSRHAVLRWMLEMLLIFLNQQHTRHSNLGHAWHVTPLIKISQTFGYYLFLILWNKNIFNVTYVEEF